MALPLSPQRGISIKTVHCSFQAASSWAGGRKEKQLGGKSAPELEPKWHTDVYQFGSSSCCLPIPCGSKHYNIAFASSFILQDNARTYRCARRRSDGHNQLPHGDLAPAVAC